MICFCCCLKYDFIPAKLGPGIAGGAQKGGGWCAWPGPVSSSSRVTPRCLARASCCYPHTPGGRTCSVLLWWWVQNMWPSCTVYCVLYVAEQRTVRLVSKHQPGAELAGQHWGMDHFSCCHLNFMLWKLRYNTEMLHLNFMKGVCEWFIVFHPARDTWSHNTGCYRVFLWGTLFWLLSLTCKGWLPADEVQLIPYYLSMLFVRPGQAPGLRREQCLH